MSKSFDKKDLRPLVTLLLKCKLNSHLTFMLKEVFQKIFSESEESIQPATVVTFQLLCDYYIQNGSTVLNTYFKGNIYYLLRGLSHSIPEVKESCVSALMVVLDLDEIQQYKLKKYLINEEVNHQNRITGESHHDTKLVNVCLLYTSPSPRDKRQSRMPSSA